MEPRFLTSVLTMGFDVYHGAEVFNLGLNNGIQCLSMEPRFLTSVFSNLYLNIAIVSV